MLDFAKKYRQGVETEAAARRVKYKQQWANEEKIRHQQKRRVTWKWRHKWSYTGGYLGVVLYLPILGTQCVRHMGLQIFILRLQVNIITVYGKTLELNHACMHVTRIRTTLIIIIIRGSDDEVTSRECRRKNKKKTGHTEYHKTYYTR